MEKVEILSSTVEEVPVYFEFRKNDFTGHHPTMANLDYDPFPTNELNDIVRKEIIGRKLVLRAKLKGDVFDLRPGVSLSLNGNAFAITSSKMHIETSIADVVGEKFLTPPDPMKTLAQLRASLIK